MHWEKKKKVVCKNRFSFYLPFFTVYVRKCIYIVLLEHNHCSLPDCLCCHVFQLSSSKYTSRQAIWSSFSFCFLSVLLIISQSAPVSCFLACGEKVQRQINRLTMSEPKPRVFKVTTVGLLIQIFIPTCAKHNCIQI